MCLINRKNRENGNAKHNENKDILGKLGSVISKASGKKNRIAAGLLLTIPAAIETAESRVLIISDTHGNRRNLERVLEAERPYERVIHLGDIEDAEDYMEAAAGCPVDAVRGNNDYFSSLPYERVIEAAGKRIFLTHGHYYFVEAGLEELIKETHSRGADIVMFGHIHRPLARQEGGLAVINPGSLSFPRQENHRPSYIVMEADGQNGIRFFVKYL